MPNDELQVYSADITIEMLNSDKTQNRKQDEISRDLNININYTRTTCSKWCVEDKMFYSMIIIKYKNMVKLHGQVLVNVKITSQCNLTVLTIMS